MEDGEEADEQTQCYPRVYYCTDTTTLRQQEYPTLHTATLYTPARTNFSAKQ